MFPTLLCFSITMFIALYSRFADRDAVMQFWGGGVGHKSTHKATDQFLQDRDILDLTDNKASEMDSGSDLDPEDNGKDGNSSVSGDEDQEDWIDEEEDKEDNYGYCGLSAEDSWEETDSSNSDAPDEVDDELGLEDGEGIENEIEILGYSNF